MTKCISILTTRQLLEITSALHATATFEIVHLQIKLKKVGQKCEAPQLTSSSVYVRFINIFSLSVKIRLALQTLPAACGNHYHISLPINFIIIFFIYPCVSHQVRLKLNGTHKLLVYADGVNLLGDNIDTIK
jgi:hypothetical protein